MLAPQTRKALLRVAHAVMDLAADLNPVQELPGNADDLRQMAEWMRRPIGAADARHVRRALFAVNPILLYKNPDWVAQLLRRDGGMPANVIETVRDVLQAVADLKLAESPKCDEIPAEALASLIHVAERLEAVADLIPSEIQKDILAALEGKALTLDQLETAVLRSRSTIHKPRPDGTGGLKELQDLGYVKNDRLLGGYYRPDAPPRIPESN